MGIRMSGLFSNLDTDSIIKEMMKAKRTKLTKIENKKTKMEWKQEKWKDLNTKLMALYENELTDIKKQATYLVKKVTSSNESAVTATGEDASNGAHTVQVNQLASPQYWTSGQLSSYVDAEGKTVSPTRSTKLTDLGIARGTVFTIKTQNGAKTYEYEVTSGSETLGNFVDALGKNGLSARYDEGQKRIFIGSKESGQDQSFTIESSYNTGTNGFNDIKSQIGYSALNADDKAVVDGLLTQLKDSNPAVASSAADALTSLALENFRNQKIGEEKQKIVTDMQSNSAEVAQKQQQVWDAKVLELYPSLTADDRAKITEDDIVKDFGQSKLDEINQAKQQAGVGVLSEYDKIAKSVWDDNIDALYPSLTADEKAAVTAAKIKEDFGQAKVQEIVDAQQAAGNAAAQAKLDIFIANNLPAAADGTIPPNWTVPAGSAFASDIAGIQASMQSNIAAYQSGHVDSSVSDTAINQLKLDSASRSTVAASDCEIIYNGATLTSSSNTISVNGLTLTANAVTKNDPNPNVSLNVSNDVDGMYNTVKNFVKKYNEIMKEMNALYDADSARGYEPLTDEEKEAMTDKQIEKWEDKIKSAILRRDDVLGTLVSNMRTSLMGSVEVDGKKYSLASFGIQTSDIDFKEGGLLHIYGDKEDATYSTMTDKLKKALESDPDTVVEVLTGITGKLYETMQKDMKRINGVSSSLTFYHDVTIKNDISSYEKQIKQMEKKLKEEEDKYYKQFSAMEVAMSKMQSQQNALAGMLGGN